MAARAGSKRRRLDARADDARADDADSIVHTLASLHDETIQLISALEAALEALSASQSQVGDACAETCGAAENAAREACVVRMAQAVQDTEARRVAADGILEQLQAAQGAQEARKKARQAKIARADLDALYQACIVRALSDTGNSARQARAHKHVLDLAQDIADETWHVQVPLVRAAIVEQMRADLLKAASGSRSGIVRREIKELETITTADVEKLANGHATQVLPAIRKAADKYHTKIVEVLVPENAENDAVLMKTHDYEGELQNMFNKAAAATLQREEFHKHWVKRSMEDDDWPKKVYDNDVVSNAEFGMWLRALEEAQRRRFTRSTQTRILAHIEREGIFSPQFFRFAALDDLVQRGSDVTTACLEELARARRQDVENVGAGAAAAGALEGGRRAPHTPFKARSKPRSKPRSKSPSKTSKSKFKSPHRR
jgi:hypothetical protein